MSKIKSIDNIFYALKNMWMWDKAFVLYFFFSIPLHVICPLALSYFPKILIDCLRTKEDLSRIIITILLYSAALLIMKLLVNFLDNRIQMREYNLSTLYQHELMKKHMRTDYDNTDNPEKMTKYQMAIDDACSGQCAPEFIIQSLRTLFISFLGIVTYGSIISYLSPWILILLVVSSLITYFIGVWQRKYIEKNKSIWTTIGRKLNYLQGFSQKFDYAKDIRIYDMSGWIMNMLTVFQKEHFDWTKKVSARNLVGTCITALLLLLQNGSAYIILISLAVENKISAGDFVFFLGTVFGFSAWLNGVGNSVNDVITKSIKIDYYREYFKMTEKYNHERGCSLPGIQDIPVEIELEGVSFKYSSSEGEKYALNNISLKIGRGEKLAIVGENGAGKTTFVKLICGLYYPSDGTIKLNKHSVSDYNIEDYYSLFSVVFQDVFLLPVTIVEFISSSENDINIDTVIDVIRKSGLEDKINSLPDGINSKLMKGIFDDSIELSGGEKQKLMLARALYKDAPVIVLDEPTAALDPIAENELYLKYSELTANKTSIYISHRLASTRFCDRIIYLENGTIAECGSHDELMKLGGKYAHMFELQSHYYREDAKNA